MKLEELEERLLGAARSELAPSQADRERHTAALLRGDRARLPAAATRPKAAPASGGGYSALSLGLLLGALVGGGAGFVWGQRLGAASAVTSTPIAPGVSAGERPAEPGAPENTGLGQGAVVAPAPTAEMRVLPERGLASTTAPAELADDASSSRRARAAAPRSSAPRPPAASSVSVELSMLQRARRALNAKNGRLALGIVQELDERFPRGLLMEERQATRVLSLCELGRIGQAAHAALEFEQRYASSVYGERVRQSCVTAREE